MLSWNWDDISTGLPQGPQKLYGYHGNVAQMSPKLALARKQLWGATGEVLIIGRQTTQQLSVNLWLNDPSWTTLLSLDTFVTQTLDKLVGTYGYLTVGPDPGGYWDIEQWERFDNCLMMPYDCLAFPGQDGPNPVQDIAGSLYPDGQDAGAQSWVTNIRLNFLQSIPGRSFT